MFWDKETERYLLHRLKVLHYSVQCPEREDSAQQNGHKIHFCKEDRKRFCQKKPHNQKQPQKQTKKPPVPLVQFSHLEKQSETDLTPLSNYISQNKASALWQQVQSQSTEQFQNPLHCACGTHYQPCMCWDSSGIFTKTGQSSRPALSLLYDRGSFKYVTQRSLRYLWEKTLAVSFFPQGLLPAWLYFQEWQGGPEL